MSHRFFIFTFALALFASLTTLFAAVDQLDVSRMSEEFINDLVNPDVGAFPPRGSIEAYRYVFFGDHSGLKCWTVSRNDPTKPFVVEAYARRSMGRGPTDVRTKSSLAEAQSMEIQACASRLRSAAPPQNIPYVPILDGYETIVSVFRDGKAHSYHRQVDYRQESDGEIDEMARLIFGTVEITVKRTATEERRQKPNNESSPPPPSATPPANKK